MIHAHKVMYFRNIAQQLITEIDHCTAQ